MGARSSLPDSHSYHNRLLLLTAAPLTVEREGLELSRPPRTLRTRALELNGFKSTRRCMTSTSDPVFTFLLSCYREENYFLCFSSLVALNLDYHGHSSSLAFRIWFLESAGQRPDGVVTAKLPVSTEYGAGITCRLRAGVSFWQRRVQCMHSAVDST